jgi:ubiquinone/menaquinone biosynthesis C-methylase UbiE
VRTRRSPGALLRHAVNHPERTRRYLRRLRRDVVLRVRNRGDHVSYYRAVMADTVVRGDARAVGNVERARWRELGKLQFTYLKGHGLRRDHRMLEIGCGNLRAGWRFIRYLDEDNYYGIDISPEVLLAALDTLADRGLTAKRPHLTLVDDLTFRFLPDEAFDVVHAHSVFSHSPLAVIEECFANVGRIMRPDGFFDFTFDRTEGKEHTVLREDFYYRTETLLDAARRYGLVAEFMADWEELPHKQSKIRVRRG